MSTPVLRTPRIVANIGSSAVAYAVVAAALVLAGVPVAGADPRKTDDGVITTQERDCLETNDRRPVPLAQARDFVPEQYEVRVFGDPTAPVANVGFVDYVCRSFSVNGHKPRPTIMSLGTVLVRREGQNTGLVLWWGTDNPILFARLRQLGANVHFIPRSDYSETVDGAGLRQITVRYVDSGPGGLDYTRTITVRQPTPGGMPITNTARFWHLGDEGEMSVVFQNSFEPTWRASVCFDLAPGSLPEQYGITEFANPGSCFPTLRTFAEGSWTGTYQLITP